MAWGTCYVNFEALLITISIIGVMILMALTIFCCWCCRSYHKRKIEKYQREVTKFDREQENLKLRAAERKQHRQAKVDGIRDKYGLRVENPFYKRLD
ncbi:pituitary tumor-transforming gene 1 protein-interacting protein-like [Limulus polyphemus]|uniref:Pituitary tumor-transforming gene 1 protein-interacting protein-like n=1 Tax=Limulus polyphemus TaxID=6850 RepID=A0ABM1SP03_LIMPO|nr:pituitary tumor-transforming gene 1 protein-interacting protein-like [Limulus polyphemus]